VLSVGEPDGAGVLRVLDETEDGLLCHECGRRFVHLGLHAWRRHGVSADDYRVAHGLARTRGLVTTATPPTAQVGRNRRADVGGKREALAAVSLPNVMEPPGAPVDVVQADTGDLS
jgi:hypothetical protein